MDTRRLTEADAGEVLTLQRAAWVVEAIANGTLDIPALHESLAVVRAGLADAGTSTWGLRDDGRLVGIVRTTVVGPTAHVGRLGVAPDRQGEGLGGLLLAASEERVPEDVRTFALITGAASLGNHRFYERRGYRLVVGADCPPGTVAFEKARAR